MARRFMPRSLWPRWRRKRSSKTRIDQLIETGLSYIPADCLITRLIKDVRSWSSTDRNWRATRARIEEIYGNDKFPVNCHVIPNHAIIILSLLYSEDDFRWPLITTQPPPYATASNPPI